MFELSTLGMQLTALLRRAESHVRAALRCLSCFSDSLPRVLGCDLLITIDSDPLHRFGAEANLRERMQIYKQVRRMWT